MRRVILFISACLLLTAAQAAPQGKKAKAAPWKAKHVVLIGIDGWGAYSVAKAKIPNIRQLM